MTDDSMVPARRAEPTTKAPEARDEPAQNEVRLPAPTQEAGTPASRRDRDSATPATARSKPAAPKADVPADEPEDTRSRRQKAADFVRTHPLGVAIGVILIVAAIVGGVLWYLAARHWESTDDAFIDGRAFSIAPKVGGYVVEVLVTDNQHVEAGAVLARIDERDYKVALAQAEAQVQQAEAMVGSAEAQIAAALAQVAEAEQQVNQSEAAMEFQRDENARAQELVRKGAGTVQRAQQTASELVQGEATLSRSKAALAASKRQVAVSEAQKKSAEAALTQNRAQADQARLNLSYTTLVAAQPGRVARLSGAKGQLAQPGQALSMFVPDEIWVTANYKETQLTDMRPGQTVEMTIDAYPDRRLRGHVESVQAGSGTAFSLLPAQNATGNYVKVVQRVPVKIVIDEAPTDITIGPGMSVVPRVRVR